jgi:hypothetical protein
MYVADPMPLLGYSGVVAITWRVSEDEIVMARERNLLLK